MVEHSEEKESFHSTQDSEEDIRLSNSKSVKKKLIGMLPERKIEMTIHSSAHNFSKAFFERTDWQWSVEGSFSY